MSYIRNKKNLKDLKTELYLQDIDFSDVCYPRDLYRQEKYDKYAREHFLYQCICKRNGEPITIEYFADKLNTSERTIQTDLRKLENEGKIRIEKGLVAGKQSANRYYAIIEDEKKVIKYYIIPIVLAKFENEYKILIPRSQYVDNWKMPTTNLREEETNVLAGKRCLKNTYNIEITNNNFKGIIGTFEDDNADRYYAMLYVFNTPPTIKLVDKHYYLYKWNDLKYSLRKLKKLERNIVREVIALLEDNTL